MLILYRKKIIKICILSYQYKGDTYQIIINNSICCKSMNNITFSTFVILSFC